MSKRTTPGVSHPARMAGGTEEQAAFEDAIAEVQALLAPLYEREDPTTLGDKTSTFIAETVWGAVDHALEVGGVVMQQVDPKEQPSWGHAYNLCLVAKEVTGSADEDAPIHTLHSLYELLGDGLDRIQRERQARAEAEKAENDSAATEPWSGGGGTSGPELDIREIQEAGILLRRVAQNLNGGEGDRSQKVRLRLLEQLRDRSLALCELMWRVESFTPGNKKPPRFGEVHEVLFALPVLLLATEYAIQEPTAVPFARGGSQRWRWCAYLGEDIGGRLVEWAESHDSVAAMEVAHA